MNKITKLLLLIALLIGAGLYAAKPTSNTPVTVKSVSLLADLGRSLSWTDAQTGPGASCSNCLIESPVIRYIYPDNEGCYGFSGTVPADYVSSPTIRLLWAGSGAAGNVKWEVRFLSAGEFGNIDPAAWPNVQPITTAAGAFGVLVPSSAAFSATLTPGEVIFGQVCRIGQDAADTYPDALDLYAIRLDYQ